MMDDLISRQELKKKFWNDVALSLWMKRTTKTAMESLSKTCDIIDSMPSVEAAPRWIPTSERLPEERKKSYWICTDTGYQCQCRWTNNKYGFLVEEEYGWNIFDVPQYQKVVAWMELPEPYRKEERDD